MVLKAPAGSKERNAEFIKWFAKTCIDGHIDIKTFGSYTRQLTKEQKESVVVICRAILHLCGLVNFYQSEFKAKGSICDATKQAGYHGLCSDANLSADFLANPEKYFSIWEKIADGKILELLAACEKSEAGKFVRF